MKTLLISILMLPFFSINPSLIDSAEEIAGDSCTVTTDCNRDGKADFEAVVDCEYAEDLGEQFEDSCS